MDKIESWRNQTLINRINSDSQILVEYYSLINFIKESYTQGRYEAIQSPCLHLISHSIELFYKVVLERAVDLNCLKLEKNKFIHEHDITKLRDQTFELFNFFASQKSCSDTDLAYFTKEFKDLHNDFCEKIQTKTATYRYALKRNYQGNVIGKAIPFEQDKESPNMLDVYETYDKVYASLAYTDFILDFFEIEVNIAYAN